MPTLSRDLRRALENTIANARKIAEVGAEQALKELGVHHHEPWPQEGLDRRALREKLRAHGKQLGDKRAPNRSQEITRLKQACAYEQWHRMLFARFLAENNLLIHPDYGEPTSLDEVKELAREQNVDWLSLASSFAQRMLLEVFRPDDPVLHVVLPAETRQKLEEEMAGLSSEIFTAEDSLGWVYQFWQRDEKDAVNKSEVKIGADELAAVTQLFTEDYMVLFLLHNTLGAWWTAKRRGEGKDFVLGGYEWTYLRLNEDGTPAAGSYDTWPKLARDLRVLDPCMGSGHFLTFAVPILARMRAEEEGLPLSDAVIAVLRDNLFGLELDGRCSQIAAFNLAMTAWKTAGRYLELPPLNLACSGLGIHAKEEDWMRLAGSDGRKQDLMRWLYSLFLNAPTLGSLIDPQRVGKPMVEDELANLLPLLEQALAAEQPNDDTRELAIAAKGLLEAMRILSQSFTLVATNVPYLMSGNQGPVLKTYCTENHCTAKADLATCFIERSIAACQAHGTIALVSPQNWIFQPAYIGFRKHLLQQYRWNLLAQLGPRAFETISGEVVKVTLTALTRQSSFATNTFLGIDVGAFPDASAKENALRMTPVTQVMQAAQLDNPEHRIVIAGPFKGTVLASHARSHQGIKTTDDPWFIRYFWELPRITNGWEFHQSTVASQTPFGGREQVILYECGRGKLRALAESQERDRRRDLQGVNAWNKRGVAISCTGNLPATLYTGEKFDTNVAVLIPHQPEELRALWAFCCSPEFSSRVRKIDQSLKVTNATLVKIPFDHGFWITSAQENASADLPYPNTTDPTQWLFNGHPKNADHPLQVAVARLVGYEWPRQTGSSFLDCSSLEPDGLEAHADADGIVCLSSLGGEAPAADRLRALLADSFGAEWTAAKLAELLGDCNSLELWLRDRCFVEHCELFYNRPFVWHVCDGRKDGFHALVNYHKLAAANGEGRKTLEKLIYTALGDWISRQKAEVASNVEGADARLTAALHLQSELEKILVGETPYDIFVRWKPIHEQSIGWDPDPNDGVRLNIRPLLTATLAPHTKPKKGACVLRGTPIKLPLGKDKGREPQHDDVAFPWFAGTTDRNNDVHLSLDEKQQAQDRRMK
jgi:hypothetical protein